MVESLFGPTIDTTPEVMDFVFDNDLDLDLRDVAGFQRVMGLP